MRHIQDAEDEEAEVSVADVIASPDDMLLKRIAGEAAAGDGARGHSPEMWSASQRPGVRSPRRAAPATAMSGGGKSNSNATTGGHNISASAAATNTNASMANDGAAVSAALSAAADAPSALRGWRVAVTGTRQALGPNGAGPEVGKAELERRVSQAGGTVLQREEELSASGTQLPTALRATTVLLASAPRRTEKYLLALALGVACVRPAWVSATLAAGAAAPLEPHLLPAGTSHVVPSAAGARTSSRARYVAQRRLVPQRRGSDWCPVFAGLSVALTETRVEEHPQAAMWARVLPAAGARLVEASVVRRGPELEDGFDCECLLAPTASAWSGQDADSAQQQGGAGGRRDRDKSRGSGAAAAADSERERDRGKEVLPAWVCRAVRELGLVVATPEWAIQCLIHNRRLPFDLHPSFTIAVD